MSKWWVLAVVVGCITIAGCSQQKNLDSGEEMVIPISSGDLKVRHPAGSPPVTILVDVPTSTHARAEAQLRSQSKKYGIQIVIPDSKTDYKILAFEPNPMMEYSMHVINPWPNGEGACSRPAPKRELGGASPAAK